MGSYTTFEFNHLKVKAEHVVSQDTIQSTNEKFEGDADLYDYLVSLALPYLFNGNVGYRLMNQYVASVNVTNTGKVDGAAVPQLVSDPRSLSAGKGLMDSVHVLPPFRGRAATKAFEGLREGIPQSRGEQSGRVQTRQSSIFTVGNGC